MVCAAGSAGRRDEESEEERQLYDAVLTPVLQQMAACRAPTGLLVVVVTIAS